jgi:penicillin amidase
MEAMQLDNTNSFAVDALPVLRARIDSGKLNTAERKWLSALAGWNGAYDLHDEHARLFELWWANIKADTWDELRQYDFSASTPSDYTLLDLIRNQPSDSFFDIQGTAVREQAGDIVLEALRDAVTRYDSLRKTGQTDWGAGNKVNIEHMTRIPAFGRIGLPVAGSPDAIDAMASNWGPSWRMIVELGDRPRAFGIYAGGQSGNIGSIHYDDFVDDWAKGKYYSLLFFVTMSEARAQTTRRWELR